MNKASKQASKQAGKKLSKNEGMSGDSSTVKGVDGLEKTDDIREEK
jgi:hypothetical protein